MLSELGIPTVIEAPALSGSYHAVTAKFRHGGLFSEGELGMKIKDMVGVVVAGNTGIRFIGSERNRAIWEWRCHCGKLFIRSGAQIRNAERNGTQTGCGCDKVELARKSGWRNATHRLSGTRLYDVYRQMRTRCENPKCKDYPGYGGRGIKICDAWRDINAFMKWAEESGYQDNLTIERKDFNGDYTPENCTWTENAKQSHNTRRNVFLTYNGETLHVNEWARRTGFHFQTILRRKRVGWSDEKTLTVVPVLGRNQTYNA